MKVDLDDFNPRSHEGSDSGTGHVVSTTDIFQSTLPRGERLSRSLVVLYELLDFNPRSHEGSDCARRAVVSLMVYFNPRSHEGSDAITILCSI